MICVELTRISKSFFCIKMRHKCFSYYLTIFVVFLNFFPQIRSQDKSSEPKDLYQALGSSVELTCVNGSEWRFNGSSVVSSHVLRLHNTSLDDQGFYTCHDSIGGTVEMIRLQLGYPPPVPDIHCWSPSYPLQALCLWTLPQDPILPTYYISTYRHLEEIYSCQRASEQDRQCVLEELDLWSNVPYLVNITAVNALGSASRILPVIIEGIGTARSCLVDKRGHKEGFDNFFTPGVDRKAFHNMLNHMSSNSRFHSWQPGTVKPDPPVNVKVVALPGKKLHVKWAPPPTWPDPVTFPLKYKVQFQWGNPSTTSIMGPYESESMVRSGVMPGRMYHIRVSVMDLLGHGQSSEWSDTVNITLPRS